MRRQFVATVESLLAQNERVFLLLGDIGVFGFRNAFAKYPERVLNIGILEQATVSFAAGLAKEGFIPIFHSIAPFIVERAFEQLKVDFGYQGLGGVFVTVGASYDYASLGCTHHCPADVALLKTIPGMKILVPGSEADLDTLFRQTYISPSPTYFRLTEQGHALDVRVDFGQAAKIRDGKHGTVIVVGPLLERVKEACSDLDVTLLYYTTLTPFDSETLLSSISSDKIAVIEPFYEGTLAFDVISTIPDKAISLLSIGVPRKFHTSYGKASDHDRMCGLDTGQIKTRLEMFFNEKT